MQRHARAGVGGCGDGRVSADPAGKACSPPPHTPSRARARARRLSTTAISWAGDRSARPATVTPTAVVAAMLARGRVLQPGERPWAAFFRLAWPQLLRHTFTVGSSDGAAWQAQLTGEGARLVRDAVAEVGAVLAAAAAAQPAP